MQKRWSERGLEDFFSKCKIAPICWKSLIYFVECLHGNVSQCVNQMNHGSSYRMRLQTLGIPFAKLFFFLTRRFLLREILKYLSRVNFVNGNGL